MIHHAVEPGSSEWFRLHMGIPTAGNMHLIITPARWLYSKSARPYAFRLAAEVLLQEMTMPLSGIEQMERGKAMEPLAVQMYEFAERVESAPCGFLTTDDGAVGATPDRLLPGQNAALEVKCPSNWVHLQYLIDGFGSDYLPQVFGQMLVGEFDYVDRYSFHPRMPPRLVRTVRDHERITTLAFILKQFCEERDAIIEKLRAEGLFEPGRALPLDQAYGEFGRMMPEDEP